MSTEDEIRRTLARYVQNYHTYEVEEFVRLFALDGAFITRPPVAEYRGHAALRAFAENRQRRAIAAPEKKVKLMCGIPLITVDGDRATALTDFIVFQYHSQGPWYPNIVGLYTDQLIRQEGGWVFAERRITEP